MEEREIQAKVKVLKERYPEVVQAILADGSRGSTTDHQGRDTGVPASVGDVAAQDAMIETMLEVARAAGRA